ncbi:hypothetical protein Ciccas_007390 [Cichlidogyrus casuarinus]|uniref:Uncharacterized protein n=1 Tax=Cichlidogyrus casuarinus TaxID=1844966 RepID=A0ABD2Q307_9PLAT
MRQIESLLTIINLISNETLINIVPKKQYIELLYNYGDEQRWIPYETKGLRKTIAIPTDITVELRNENEFVCENQDNNLTKCKCQICYELVEERRTQLKPRAVDSSSSNSIITQISQATGYTESQVIGIIVGTIIAVLVFLAILITVTCCCCGCCGLVTSCCC